MAIIPIFPSKILSVLNALQNFTLQNAIACTFLLSYGYYFQSSLKKLVSRKW